MSYWKEIVGGYFLLACPVLPHQVWSFWM